MNKVFWLFHGLLTLAFGLFGAQKIFMPIPDLIEFGMLWIEDFPAWQVRTIGVLEVVGVIGLSAPYAIKALPRWISPLAATGLALTMIGAFITHVTRSDPAMAMGINAGLFAMATTLALKRFGEMRQGGSDR